MRVLTVVRDLKIGGTQRVAQNYALSLKQCGIESAILAWNGGGLREEILRGKIDIFYKNEDTLLPSLRRALDWGPSIVHIHREGGPNEVESEIVRSFAKAGVPVVETNVFSKFDKRETNNGIDVHLQLTRWCRLRWLARGGVFARDAKSVIIPNCLDVNAFFPLPDEEKAFVRAELGIPRNRVIIGRVGQPIEAKWSLTLLKVFERMVQNGANVNLLLVGAPEKINKYIEKMHDSVKQRIMALPMTSDDRVLNKYYNSMDIFAHAARIGESFGMVLCESMLAGIPVVTLSTPFGDNSQVEVVNNGIGGVVCNNSEEFFEGLNRLTDELAYRKHLSNTCRQNVIDRFSCKVVTVMLVALYKEIVDEKNGSNSANLVEERRWAVDLVFPKNGTISRSLQRTMFTLYQTPEWQKLITFAKGIYHTLRASLRKVTSGLMSAEQR